MRTGPYFLTRVSPGMVRSREGSLRSREVSLEPQKTPSASRENSLGVDFTGLNVAEEKNKWTASLPSAKTERILEAMKTKVVPPVHAEAALGRPLFTPNTLKIVWAFVMPPVKSSQNKRVFC